MQTQNGFTSILLFRTFGSNLNTRSSEIICESIIKRQIEYFPFQHFCYSLGIKYFLFLNLGYGRLSQMLIVVSGGQQLVTNIHVIQSR